MSGWKMALQILAIRRYANLETLLKTKRKTFSRYLKKRKERPVRLSKYDDAVIKAQEILVSGDQAAIEELKKVIEEYEKR